jgi:ATP-dependent exoDNAse (exonuclease V) alpha subunit
VDLKSSKIKGICPVYAKKLVEKFGEEIFTVIDHYSVQIQEVDGIGPGRRQKIKAAWAEQRAVRDIMIFLHSYGVSTSRAVRIYKAYGDKVIETVRANRAETSLSAIMLVGYAGVSTNEQDTAAQVRALKGAKCARGRPPGRAAGKNGAISIQVA